MPQQRVAHTVANTTKRRELVYGLVYRPGFDEIFHNIHPFTSSKL